MVCPLRYRDRYRERYRNRYRYRWDRSTQFEKFLLCQGLCV